MYLERKSELCPLIFVSPLYVVVVVAHLLHLKELDVFKLWSNLKAHTTKVKTKNRI